MIVERDHRQSEQAHAVALQQLLDEAAADGDARFASEEEQLRKAVQDLRNKLGNQLAEAEKRLQQLEVEKQRLAKMLAASPAASARSPTAVAAAQRALADAAGIASDDHANGMHASGDAEISLGGVALDLSDAAEVQNFLQQVQGMDKESAKAALYEQLTSGIDGLKQDLVRADLELQGMLAQIGDNEEDQ